MSWGVLIVVALLALIPAKIAERKGRSLGVWWLFGFVFLIIALPASLIIRDNRYGECPWCGENVRTTALVCPHCRRDVTPFDADGEPDYTLRP